MSSKKSSLHPSERFLKAFGVSLAHCQSEAIAYSLCVTSLVEDITKHACQSEFDALKKCFRSKLREVLTPRKS